ncbi:hypothetical protein HHX47_DHR4000457 [Lentinula edodes]|nr:hypothetical protein HHX47_DHR4000457 [Lentinula edodes]
MIPLPQTVHPRVYAYVKNGLHAEVTLRTDIICNRDIMILDVTPRGGKKVTFIHLYNDPSMGRQQILWRLRHLNLALDEPIVICGDANIHHIRWSRGAPKTSSITDEVVTWLDEHNFLLLNKKGVPTHFPHDIDKHPSVIDLTWSNVQALQIDATRDWAIDEDLAVGSDHMGIRWRMNSDSEEIENPMGIRYNMKEVKPTEWIEAFDNEMELRKDKFQRLLESDNTLTHDDLDAVTDAFTDAMKEATAKVAPVRNPSTRAKPWWDGACAEALNRVQVAERVRRHNRMENGFSNEWLEKSAKHEKNHFHRLTKWKKQEWAVKTVEEAHPEDIYSFRKWSKGGRQYPMPAIERPGQLPATTHAEKCKALRDELYQPPPALPDEYPINITDTLPGDLPYQEVTETEVAEAIKDTSNTSAPGFSQQSYRQVKWAFQSQRNVMTALYRQCLRAGYHPRAWRKAIAVALRKPRKPDYSKPRAYRLITLLECLGKVLEKIVARRLQYMASAHNLIPAQQFGGRAGLSTTDAILSFVNDVQAAWNHDMVTSALTFDIKGFFDFVNHDRLLYELRRKGIPLQIVQFVKYFLSDRKAAVCVDGITSNLEDVANGTPQGSPLSPILSAFYAAELLETLECRSQKYQQSPGSDGQETPPPNLFMFVDDGKLHVCSYSLELNTAILKAIWIEVIVPWGKKVGLSFDFDKRELMHYTRRKRDNNVSPSITFHDDDGLTRVVAPQAVVRWLGVYFDRKLLFNHHVKTLAGSAGKAVGSLIMLANTVKGLSPYHMRMMYKSCVVPVMTYASAAWWTGKITHERLLEKVQHRGLRLICAVFRTTPIAAMEIEASIPPVRVELNRLNRNCALRFNKLSTSNPIIQRLDNTWRAGRPPSRPPAVHYKLNRKGKKDENRTTQLQNIARLTNSSDERLLPFSTPPWRRVGSDFGNRLRFIPPPPKGKEEDKKKRMHKQVQEHKTKLSILQSHSKNLCIYTDGSLKPIRRIRRAGAGLVAYQNNIEMFSRSIGLGFHAEAYDGEIVALSYAAGLAANMSSQDDSITHWQFFTDSASSIDSIFDTSPKPGQVYCSNFYRKVVEFLDSDPLHSVEVAWVPSHIGIIGNERADFLAKMGTEQKNEAMWGRSRSNALRLNKVRAEREWKKKWESRSTYGRFAIANQLPPSLKPTKRLKETPREVFGRLTQCRTGHAFLGEYYAQFVPGENINCPCGEDLQTREHILRACPRYDNFRHILRKASDDICLKEILGTEEGIEALTEFLEESGAFTKTGKQRPIAEAPMYTPLGIGEELEAMFHGPTGEEMTPEADWREEVIDSDNSDTEI